MPLVDWELLHSDLLARRTEFIYIAMFNPLLNKFIAFSLTINENIFGFIISEGVLLKCLTLIP